MALTKQQAIDWHKILWLYIANKIAKEKKVLDVAKLKRKFCRMNKLDVKNDCFCCDYVYMNNKEIWYNNDFDCVKKCPVIWGKDMSCVCFDYNAEYYVIISHRNFLRKNGWKKQAKLAYKIAMLPEREEA